MNKKMRALIAGLAVAGVAALGFVALPASAEVTAANPCGVEGFYGNPDETPAQDPARSYKGFTFEGTDLIHHAVPSGGIDFADMDKVRYTFRATGTTDKLVYKVETSSPYSTIITQPDGKLWSTAMAYGTVGGQGNPVDKYTDLLGKPTKPGKAMFSSDSQVKTFGVGHWTETGSALLTAIMFHGTTYTLSCKVPLALGEARYNPSGTDAGTNLVNEFVRVKNTGKVAVNIKGYTLRDRGVNVYTFADLNLNAGATVTVRTGKGTNTGANVYFNHGHEIWNDSDAATVRDDLNVTLDNCSWTKTASGVKNC
jgi:lamin tail-like protein